MSLIYVNTIQPQTGSIVNISGSLQISQSLIVADDITLGGKITLGDANTDAIVVNAEFTSSLIPDLDGYFDLGTVAKNWGTMFAKTGSFQTITVSGSGNTFTNWGNFRNRFPQDDRSFEVTTDPSVVGGWKYGAASGASGSAPHLHFMLSGSGQAGIGLLNPQHTLHISSSNSSWEALYVQGNVSSSGTGSFKGGSRPGWY